MDSRPPLPPRLESWKEIAHHLNRTVRTVQRWEREQGLPVHRLQHNKQATIFAYAHELDAWWGQRKVALEREESPHGESPPAPARISRRVAFAALGAGILVAVLGFAIDRYRRPTESDRLYALAREQWNERTQPGFREALRLFNRAIDADPSNARAYAGLADTYALLDAFSDMPRALALPNAHAAAAKAVQLNDRLGESHASLGFVLWAEGDRDGAFREIEHAMALDPNYATAFHWYALFLQDSGRYGDAVTAARRAHELAPDSKIIASDLAIVLRSSGLTAESAAVLEQLVAKHPHFAEAYVQLAEVYRNERRFDLAAQQLTLAMQNGDARPTTQARRAWLSAQSGNLRHAMDTLTRFKMMQQQGQYVPPLALLEAVAAAGDLDLAFSIIDRAIRDNESWVTLVPDGMIFKQLTDDPRWAAVKPRVAAVITSPAREAFSAIAKSK